MTIEQLLDELEGRPDFSGDLADYFCISRSEIARLAERAESADDVDYIMAREDWWRDAPAPIMPHRAAAAEFGARH